MHNSKKTYSLSAVKSQIIFLLIIFLSFSYSFTNDTDTIYVIRNNEKFLDMNTQFSHQKNHIPGSKFNKTVKTVYIAYNIWQDDNGDNHLPDNEFTINKLNQITTWMTNIFKNVPPPSRPIEGVKYLHDSYIRFETKRIIFHRNSEFNYANYSSGKKLNDYLFQNYPENRQYLNIHFNLNDTKGGGFANYPNGSNLKADSYTVMFFKNDFSDYQNLPYWALMLNIMHELGHNFDLKHPYNSEPCRFSHPDFLFDLFGFETQQWCKTPGRNCDICYHEKGWNCGVKDTNTTCTNNIMASTANTGSITPLQMGRIHRSLKNKHVRKYAWGFSEQPYVVAENQFWNINMKFYSDIRIKSGAKLWIKNDLEMVPGSSIILEPGSELIVDGANITSALYAENKWNGIEKEPGETTGFWFWKKTTPEGSIVIENKGFVEGIPQN